MKKLYLFTIAFVASLILSNSSFAQTGIYTAVRNGNWDASSGGVNPWDPNGKPPANCSGCIITINSGAIVTLNASVTLANSSVLIIGTDASLGSAGLNIVASTGTDFASSHNVIALNDGSSPANVIRIVNTISFINPSGGNSNFDGIFTTFGSSPMYYLKSLGNGPSIYSTTGAVNFNNANSNALFGSVTLSGNGTLPITLSDFEAVSENNEVDLTWTTSLEINSDHFVIQRSTNGGARWDDLGTVAAKGSSALSVNYSYTDVNPSSGVNDYRLQLVDMDGKFTYSVIKVVHNRLVGSVGIYPNPARDYVTVTLGVTDSPANVSIRLISQSGQVLTEKTVSNTGGTKVSLSVGNYPTGNYLVVATGADGTQQVSKLFISK